MVLFSHVEDSFGWLVVVAVGIVVAFEINYDDDYALSGLVVLLRKISIDLAQAAVLDIVIIV